MKKAKNNSTLKEKWHQRKPKIKKRPLKIEKEIKRQKTENPHTKKKRRPPKPRKTRYGNEDY